MHIHIVGIAGNMTAPLAVELQKHGHTVTGSDQEKIYPPISTILDRAGIKLNQNLITKSIDLAIIGSSFKNFNQTKKEYSQIKKLKIPHISATKYIAANFPSGDCTLVAGSYGKTTITSLLAWILTKTNPRLSYLFGGIALNDFPSLRFYESGSSLIEADESINGLDTKAKFLYYPVNNLIITSAEWEHKECYPKEIENFNAFKKLVSRLPKNGLLVINYSGHKTVDLAKFSPARVVFYNKPESGYFIEKYTIVDGQCTLDIRSSSKKYQFHCPLLGIYNFENTLAAVTICLEMGLDPEIINTALKNYPGIFRRMELKSSAGNIRIFDDSAQSASRINAALSSLRLHYPDSKIKVFFEPHASFLQNKLSLEGFPDAFGNANEIVLGEISFSRHLKKPDRVTAADYRQILGQKLNYQPISQNIVEHFQQTLKPGDVLVRLSTGGQNGNDTLQKIINYFH